jgi:hypothetical protein
MTMKADHFTFHIAWSEEDKEHVGLCSEFPLLSWLAHTPEGALAGIRKLVHGAVQDMESAGETGPNPDAVKRPLAVALESFHGSIRLPKTVTAKSLIREGRR